MWLRTLSYIFLTTGVLLSCLIMEDTTQGSIIYARDQLMNLWLCSVAGRRPDIPRELRRKHRGCRSGRRRWLRKKRYRPYLPSIIMGNWWYLANKITSPTKSESVFRREGSVLCFRETWLHDVPDTIVSLAGFQLVQADRSCSEGAKKKWGGVAIFTWTTDGANLETLEWKNVCAARTSNCEQ